MTKTYPIFHGTVTGKDNLFLEKFIATGALSKNSRDPWDQHAGCYASTNALGAFLFAQHQTTPKRAEENGTPERCGRGMIVEIQAYLDPQSWDIDHEMSNGHSIKLLYALKDVFPCLDLKKEYKNASGYISTSPIRLLSVTDTGDACEIRYLNKKFGEEKTKTCSLSWSDKESYLGDRDNAFFVDKVLDLIRETAPGKYMTEKHLILLDMAKTGEGYLKYTGDAPLPVSKVYLRPIDDAFIYKDEYNPADPLQRWEVVYDATSLPDKAPFDIGYVKKMTCLTPK